MKEILQISMKTDWIGSYKTKIYQRKEEDQTDQHMKRKDSHCIRSFSKPPRYTNCTKLPQ